MENATRKKRLFAGKAQADGMVVLNWHGTPDLEFALFAESFHFVGQEAVAALRQNPHFGLDGIPIQDFRAYPIVFLYRHALELYMKTVILTGSPVLSIAGLAAVEREQLLTTHSLQKLGELLEQVFHAYEWKWDLGTDQFRSLDDFRRTIAELNEIDAGSYAFRYPVDTKGRDSLKRDFRFNVFDFCEVMDGLLNALQGATYAAYEELDATRELNREEATGEMEP